ncbi:MAG: hypothetical protein WAS33_07665, partial [Candidatus Promineifilaceae bacterium]
MPRKATTSTHLSDLPKTESPAPFTQRVTRSHPPLGYHAVITDKETVMNSRTTILTEDKLQQTLHLPDGRLLSYAE